MPPLLARPSDLKETPVRDPPHNGAINPDDACLTGHRATRYGPSVCLKGPTEVSRVEVRNGVRRMAVALLVGAILGSVGIGVGAVPAVILTNIGQVAEGSLSGIAPTIRLMTTNGMTSIGPGPQFDIPLTSIRQITLDFPRIVIETETGTLIGPYSSFRGISQALQLDRAGEPVVEIPTSSLRAIALNGRSLHPVPRIWLGDGYLSMPEITGASPFLPEECEDCTISPPQLRNADADLTPIWNGLSADYIPEEPAELPWWVGLLGVAALIAIAYLLTSVGGSSS